MALNLIVPQIISRKDGRSIVAKAAYNARTKLRDERTGETKDYSHLDGLEWQGVFLDPARKNPALSEWMKDRQQLYNAYERKADQSTRPNDAQLAREFLITLPHELDADQRRMLITDFARELARQGLIVDVSIHKPHEHGDERNYHAHMLLGMYRIDENTGQLSAKKERAWNSKQWYQKVHQRWSELGARYLERAGFDVEAERFRYGHLPREQQIEKAEQRGDLDHARDLRNREPGEHLGPHVWAMERKGIETDLGNAAREIQQRNEDLSTLRDLKRDLARLERQDAFEKLKEELSKADKLLAETRRAERERCPSRMEELNSQIFHALFREAVRHPERLADVQMLAWRMPGNFAVDLNNAIAEIEATRHLGLNDLAKLINQHERHSLEYQRAELDALKRLRSPERTALPLAEAQDRMNASASKIAELDAAISNGLVRHLIREPGRLDEIQILAHRLPGDLMMDFQAATEAHERVRNFELPDIKKLVTEYNRQDHLRIATEMEKMVQAGLEREYAKRDPVREQIAWEDAVAKAAIEKEEREQRFIAKEDREKETRAGGKQAAPQLGATQAQIRLVRVLSPGPQSFANALEDRGLILACMTEADAERLNRWERERLKELGQGAKSEQSQTRGVDTWFAQTGGLGNLSPELRERAHASYDQWDGDKEKYGLASYVSYVQAREAERRASPEPESDLRPRERYTAGALVVVNQYGDIFHLTSRNTGLNRDELPKYLKGIDRTPLLNVSAAQSVAAAARHHQRQEKQEVWEQKRAAAPPKFGDILLSYAVKTAMRDPHQQHGEPVSGGVFRDALEQHRLALACVTPEEASQSYKGYREAQLAKELGRDMPDYAPVYQAGEIVVVREPRKDGHTNRVHKLDQTKAEDYLRCLGIDKSQLRGIEATKQALDDRAQVRQRAIDAAQLRKGRSPQRGGLVAQEKWAMQRLKEAARQRRQQPYHPEEHAEKQRREQEFRRREDDEKRKRDAGDQLDAERYRTDPEYRRQVQQTQEWKSPEDKQRDRENALRALIEQQDRGR